MIEQREKEEQEFNQTYEHISQSDTSPDENLLGDHVTNLGNTLFEMFGEAERDRANFIEEDWLKDLRQYKGEYDPDVESKISPYRSKAFMSITKTKVNTISARMADLLFPANGEKNWSVNPSPIPELSMPVMEQIGMQIMQVTGRAPQPEEIHALVIDEAKKRSNKMNKVIEDQLAELKYRDIIRRVIKSGNLYGTGILKGPLNKHTEAHRWIKGPNGWTQIVIKHVTPYCEFIPVWDIYPDMSVTEPEDMNYIFQRYIFNRKQLYELAKRNDFDEKPIRDFIEAHPEGNASVKNHETNLKDLSRDELSPSPIARRNQYQVLEFWGYLKTKDLIDDLGFDLDEEALGPEVAANVWLLDNIVIKATLAPAIGSSFPYYFYYYNKDETSIFGEGIPRVLRHSQSLVNSSIRAMLDNAAISAGPLIEVNTDLLSPGEDPTSIYPFRVFMREGQGSEAASNAVNVYSIRAYTAEFMKMAEFFMNMADEVSVIPRYMYGDTNNVKGAGATATGLSLLMGATNVTLKDQTKNFDDGVTIPFIRAMYFWNMANNPDEKIKGDYEVRAYGSTSLIAKEIRNEQLSNFAMLTNNPVDLQFVNRDEILRELARSMDLDDLNIIKNPQQVSFEQRQQAEEAQRQQKFSEQMELLKAKSSGHVDDDGTVREDGGNNSPRATLEQVNPAAIQQGDIPQVFGPDGQPLT